MDWDARDGEGGWRWPIWMNDAAISARRSGTRLDRVWYSLLDTTKDRWRGVRWHNFQMDLEVLLITTVFYSPN